MNKKTTALKEKLQKLISLDVKMETFGSNEPWNGHHFVLNPVLKEEEIALLENKYNIQLPAEYRYYISQIANGGAGPFYGLYTVETAIQNTIDRFTEGHTPDDGPFAQDFPYSDKAVTDWLAECNAKIAEGDDESIVNPDVEDNLYGVIYLSEYGCGGYYVMVVKGEQAGTVWFLQEGEYLFPCFTKKGQWDFADWFENWLDESIKPLDKSSDKKEDTVKDTTVTILNYDGHNLTEIPAEVYENKGLKKLVFSRNKLPDFPKRLTELTELRTLDISMNPIVDIDPAIGQMKNLRKLDLSYNHHTTLPASIEGLEHLEELRLVYTPKLVQFPLAVLNLKKLKKLNLYSSAIENIPADINRLTHLISLELDSNPITELPENIGELKHLQYLGLKYTKLKKLPASVSALKELEGLNICIGNFDLEDAVEKIKDLPVLQYLTVAIKQEFPANFSALKNILHLTVELNFNEEPEPTAIPENIFLPENLETLKLDLNGQYENLPDAIGNLKKLKVLDISNTKIADVPESIRQLTSLEKIMASDNLVQETRAKIEGWFPKLKWW